MTPYRLNIPSLFIHFAHSGIMMDHVKKVIKFKHLYGVIDSLIVFQRKMKLG